jgi:alkylated DNA repair dioxygenase AlkB
LAILVAMSVPETGTDLRIDRHAAVTRTPLAPNSWVDLVPGFARDAATQFTELEAGAEWSQREVLRYDRYVPDRRLGAAFRSDAHPLLRQTDLLLRSRYGQQMTSIAGILYRDGDDFQGLHSDREMGWLDDTLIAILVLGARRPFVLRPRGDRIPVEKVPPGSHPDDLVLTPGEGDLLVMGAACQREWLHGVPAVPGLTRPRISLTWRWTSRRGRPDTNPTFYDGRHYSDGARQPGNRVVRP